MIEIVTPNGVFHSKVEVIKKMTTVNNATSKDRLDDISYKPGLTQDVTSAHGGGYEVWINMEKDYGEFALIRKIALDGALVEA